MSSLIDTLAGRKRLQLALIAAGYSVGPDGADGKLGTDTAKAIRAFRKDHGLSEAATVDAKLISLLNLNQDQGPIPMNKILGGIFDGLLGNLLNWQLVQGYIRSALVAAGGWIGLDGLVGTDGSKQIIGAILVILSVIWQAIANNKKAKALAVVKAVDAHPAITVIPANQNVTGKPAVIVDKAA